MSTVKKCRHGGGLRGASRRRAWRRCGCTWYADLYVDGRRRYIALGPDERQARIDHAQLLADREANRLRGGGPALSDVAERWLATREADPDARANSLASYRSRINHIEAWFGNVAVTRIRPADVREFTQSLEGSGRKPMTVAGVYATLSCILRHAVDEGLIEQAPLPGRRPVRNVPRPRQHLTLREARQLVDALEEPWGSLAEAALLTGLRAGELLALTLDDVALERGVLYVRRNRAADGTMGPPKTASGERAVPLSPRAVEVLRGRIEGADPYLWDHSYRQAQGALREAMKALGIYRKGMGWHSLRHAHTALLDAAGTPLRDAGVRLGHGANTTQSLAYGWSAEQGDAAAVDEALRRH